MLIDLAKDVKDLRQEIKTLCIDVSALKVRAGTAGFIGGLLPAIAIAVLFLLSKIVH